MSEMANFIYSASTLSGFEPRIVETLTIPKLVTFLAKIR